jgi:hypothetical protein
MPFFASAALRSGLSGWAEEGRRKRGMPRSGRIRRNMSELSEKDEH